MRYPTAVWQGATRVPIFRIGGIGVLENLLAAR